jgi:hypothetical protein
MRKKHGKSSVRVAGDCQLAKKIQNRANMSIRIYKHSDKYNKIRWAGLFDARKISNASLEIFTAVYLRIHLGGE